MSLKRLRAEEAVDNGSLEIQCKVLLVPLNVTVNKAAISRLTKTGMRTEVLTQGTACQAG